MISSDPLSLYELLDLLISGAGFLTVIVTIILLISQTREMAAQSKHVVETLKDSVYESVESRSLALDEIFISHPDMRPYFYSGKDISGDDLAYNKVISVADLVLDFFDSIMIRSQDFPQVPVRQSWEGFITDCFANSPVLCRHLDSIKVWHSSDLLAIMRAGEALRQQKSQT